MRGKIRCNLISISGQGMKGNSDITPPLRSTIVNHYDVAQRRQGRRPEDIMTLQGVVCMSASCSSCSTSSSASWCCAVGERTAARSSRVFRLQPFSVDKHTRVSVDCMDQRETSAREEHSSTEMHHSCSRAMGNDERDAFRATSTSRPR